MYIRRLNDILPTERLLYILSWLGRWSMLDVMVLALVVFYTKQTGVADATELPGIYFFSVAVLLTMWASELAEQQFADLRQKVEGDENIDLPLIEDQRQPRKK